MDVGPEHAGPAPSLTTSTAEWEKGIRRPNGGRNRFSRGNRFASPLLSPSHERSCHHYRTRKSFTITFLSST
jgi:hypothetical protein